MPKQQNQQDEQNQQNQPTHQPTNPTKPTSQSFAEVWFWQWGFRVFSGHWRGGRQGQRSQGWASNYSVHTSCEVLLVTGVNWNSEIVRNLPPRKRKERTRSYVWNGCCIDVHQTEALSHLKLGDHLINVLSTCICVCVFVCICMHIYVCLHTYARWWIPTVFIPIPTNGRWSNLAFMNWVETIT